MKRGAVIAVVALIVGGVGGLALAGVGATVIHETSTNAFCTVCHEMTWPERTYKESVHFTNAAGVQAQCKDCHLQGDPWPAYVWQKATFGARDVWYHLWGTIDDEETYQARRQEMAETVWAWLEETNSATCQTCHTPESMVAAAAKQSEIAAGTHEGARASGMTCIACHQGVGHGITP
ncbi:nitrate/TMAO reductase-like tetraheme cytochrome c subunit [Rhodobium orientis]|uniref:Cytochrome c-type protein n=1 Tax=Rhodobium orientis TaxID=34017 RepID=A0A327JLB4_9HYPH|nr:NapC/NirT family cytochrome c [Rhodobium orientis]MBB4305094.1 nitrate/TMAO reductase-like tetraheme cytochrome c subunit [Rhodobium orientis]MBK5952162.1 hypothetical protein [Rhodobium orientis]RAI25622.1 hypothetical protein CH339_17230 [Rhodobium orientis]